jgi:hypothetical protein
MTKRITLTNGDIALVSDCDHAYLTRWSWGYMRTRGNGGYARRTTPDRHGRQLLMHEVVARRIGLRGPQVDHRNGDKLDNRRRNLRAATTSQNKANEGIRRNNTSGFKGVYWSAWADKWMAKIKVNYKDIYLGYYRRKVDAARAYNQAARRHLGEYAQLIKV